MTPKERAVMQQALEALEEAYENGFLTGIAGLKTIDTLTTLREALKPTREGKYYYKDNACTADNADSPDCICWHDEALAEQAEQEKPYADKAAMFAQLGGMVRIDPVTGDVGIGTSPKTLDYVAPVQKAEQEPVAWGRVFDGDIIDCICPEEHALNEGDYTIPLYASPVSIAKQSETDSSSSSMRTTVRTKDLTDDEIDEIGKSYFDEWSFGFARAVIAADREKNK